ncbi:hypothetical protein [Bathymodiolus japonicus methanotrophic gill symbiont]|uniref:hypothetical protein n=1 Tax=Bathymodiolus japonicus methanotrophic gill symbiont TaxID=113269 RepID=UPI001C8D7F3F|nr:hypothetical protein [Bathymodiolus japonicus methanotrophic gill symbiont]
MRSRCGRRAFRASPIRCVGERIMATGVPEFREVAWRAWARLSQTGLEIFFFGNCKLYLKLFVVFLRCLQSVYFLL